MSAVLQIVLQILSMTMSKNADTGKWCGKFARSNVAWECSQDLPSIGTTIVHAHGACVKLAICTVIVFRGGYRSTGDRLIALAVGCAWSGTLSKGLCVMPVAEHVAVTSFVLVHRGVGAAKVRRVRLYSGHRRRCLQLAAWHDRSVNRWQVKVWPAGHGSMRAGPGWRQ